MLIAFGVKRYLERIEEARATGVVVGEVKILKRSYSIAPC
jgi:hypothetical protein